MFTETDKEYSLETTLLISPEEIEAGLFIALIGIDALPPHIALIHKGLYYSVSSKKTETGVSIIHFIKAISRRSVPTLFIQIKEFADADTLRHAAIRAFSRYPLLGKGPHSCLWPVRDFFAEAVAKKYGSASFVFELLAMAQHDGLITGCKALFTNQVNSKEKSIIQMPKYTAEQIREKINSLVTHTN